MPEEGPIERGTLPLPDRPHVGLVTYDAKDPNTGYPPIEPVRPPKGAPNVLVILLDDVGFGASSAFGGPCETPNFEKLANAGLRYNRFHTTALCAPTRAALLTGRNHHSVGMGGITEIATSAPGNNSLRPNSKARADAHAQRLLDSPVRQVPRGARVADEPDGAIRHVADRLRLRALLRLHRR
jgi:Sulfatase